MRKIGASEKLAILQEIENGQLGVMAVAKKYGLTKTTLAKWRRRYEVYGYEGGEIRTHNNRHSPELKLQAVQDYLSGQYSQYEIIYKYKIASTTQLKN
ncbi:helix-turn-helix domain-containing protein [Brevibacillus ruminantium]|uniref:Helix-turn-helix domain-containing protein n=1 Tax=Brevibacillus ruminantium TaxID=2950604 RepID=A0ABY4WCT9_9BACL|nr:helix-turn-helix domain-containing protein [Brevibacillus ruminantium]USG64980.1 helix-turn-helix domain-containing protein [Brevibacillus ruminantium]